VRSACAAFSVPRPGTPGILTRVDVWTAASTAVGAPSVRKKRGQPGSLTQCHSSKAPRSGSVGSTGIASLAPGRVRRKSLSPLLGPLPCAPADTGRRPCPSRPCAPPPDPFCFSFSFSSLGVAELSLRPASSFPFSLSEPSPDSRPAIALRADTTASVFVSGRRRTSKNLRKPAKASDSGSPRTPSPSSVSGFRNAIEALVRNASASGATCAVAPATLWSSCVVPLCCGVTDGAEAKSAPPTAPAVAVTEGGHEGVRPSLATEGGEGGRPWCCWLSPFVGWSGARGVGFLSSFSGICM